MHLKKDAVIADFDVEHGKFLSQEAEVADLAKGLATLEPQFKIVSGGDLKVIEDTIPALYQNLLKVWTSLRVTDVYKFSSVLESITIEICSKVQGRTQAMQGNADVAKQGISVLKKFIECLHKTRM